MSHKALIIVDVQNDFCKGGVLEVPGADEIVPVINNLSNSGQFSHIIVTYDYHPKNHGSFASVHNVEPFTMGKLNGMPQVMWPDHCVQHTKGAELHPDLDVSFATYILYKGGDVNVDSYSAFYDNNNTNSTGLSEYLKVNNIIDVYVVGLATDYCVKHTVLDSINEGFNTHIILDAVRGITKETTEVALRQMTKAGAILHQTYPINT